MARQNKGDIKDTDYKLGDATVDKSSLVSGESKEQMKKDKEKAASEAAEAKSSSFVIEDERDYHENEKDAPKEGDIVKVVSNGETNPSSYRQRLDELNKNLEEQYEEDNILVADETTSKPNNNKPEGDDYYEDVIPEDVPPGEKVDTSFGDAYISDSDTPTNAPLSAIKISNAPKGKVEVYLDGKAIGLKNYVEIQGKLVIKEYSKPLINMINAARKDGVNLILNDAFRTWDEQYKIRVQNVLDKNKVNDYNYISKAPTANFKPETSPPGFGYHHLGAAFDFATGGGTNAAYKWLVKNAHNYGFYRTVRSETWHWEFKPWEINSPNRSKVSGGKPWKDPFLFVSKDNSSWMGLENTIAAKRNDIDTSKAEDTEILIVTRSKKGSIDDEKTILQSCKIEAENEIKLKLKQLNKENAKYTLISEKKEEFNLFKANDIIITVYAKTEEPV